MHCKQKDSETEKQNSKQKTGNNLISAQNWTGKDLWKEIYKMEE